MKMISVCMATFNGEAYIKSQLESILKQLSSNDEVIISDDGSVDSTISIIESLNDKRIKIIYNDNNKTKNNHINVTKNFENSLNLVSGDYVFLADQDDIWKDGKVINCLNCLKDFSLVITNACVIDLEKNAFSNLYIKNPLQNFICDFWGFPIYGCTVAFRKEVLDIALPFPKKLPIHDGWIVLIAKLTGSIQFLNQNLMFYRIHNNNVSQGNNGNSIFYKLYYRIYIAYYLILRFFLKF